MTSKPPRNVRERCLEDLESMEETLRVLSDPEAMREIAEAEADLSAGDVVRGVEAARALRNG
ncbi:MAG: hypothetical protein ACRDZO_03275 [Egibacteraceae bacterium]